MEVKGAGFGSGSQKACAEVTTLLLTESVTMKHLSSLKTIFYKTIITLTYLPHIIKKKKTLKNTNME